MSVVLYHDYAYFAIKQISSFSSSCKSVKHRLHFSEVEYSHCFSSSARSLFPQDKNRNFRLQLGSSAAQTRPSNCPPTRIYSRLEQSLNTGACEPVVSGSSLPTLSRVVGSFTPVMPVCLKALPSITFTCVLERSMTPDKPRTWKNAWRPIVFRWVAAEKSTNTCWQLRYTGFNSFPLVE